MDVRHRTAYQQEIEVAGSIQYVTSGLRRLLANALDNLQENEKN